MRLRNIRIKEMKTTKLGRRVCTIDFTTGWFWFKKERERSLIQDDIHQNWWKCLSTGEPELIPGLHELWNNKYEAEKKK